MLNMGILVLDRSELLQLAKRSGILAKRMPAVSLDAEEVFRRYRGLDGEPWPRGRPSSIGAAGLASISQWDDVVCYIDNLLTRMERDVILLGNCGLTEERLAGLGWSRAGFDVGYFDGDWSHFSVVLNEVLFGIHNELRRFGGLLNSQLLCATCEDAYALVDERNRLARKGEDVERGGPAVEPVEIFIRQES
jgi:hypothetical protein